MLRLPRRSFVALAAAAFVLAAQPGLAQKRIVSLSAPLTETLYALGAQDRLVGVSNVAVFPEQVVRDRASGKLRDLGPFMRPDLAAIEALHPDLILTDTAFHRTLAKELEAKGYRVFHAEAGSLEDVLVNMERLGKAAGVEKRARAFVGKLREELAAIRKATEALPKVRVYLEINHEGPWTVGSRSPLNDIIVAAGGENIFAGHDEGTFVTTNAEIVRLRPDIILSPIWVEAKFGGIDGIIPLADIVSRPGYGVTPAVRNSRVLYYDSALLKHEGPRQILAIRKLAHLLHPAQFPDPPATIAWELGRIIP